MQASRSSAATALAEALAAADPHDAATLCAAFLEGVVTEGPCPDPFGDMARDAALWAASATVPEVATYTIAGLRTLAAEALPIGLRKRVLVALWDGLRPRERAAFLERLDPAGNFTRAAA